MKLMKAFDASSEYDDDALGQTFGQIAATGKLLRCLRRLTGDEQEAADAFQHAFVAALLKVRGAEDERAPFDMTHTEEERERWLFRTAMNKAMDSLRRQYRQYRRFVSLSPEHLVMLASPAITVEDQIQFRDEARAALAQLRPADAEIIICHVVLGYSLKELAASNGKNYDAVKKRYERAMDALRSPSNPKKGQN